MQRQLSTSRPCSGEGWPLPQPHHGQLNLETSLKRVVVGGVVAKAVGHICRCARSGKHHFISCF